MFPVEIRRVAGDKHADTPAPVFNPLFQRFDNSKSVLLKGTPCKTAFEQERGKDQVEIPGGNSRKYNKRKSKDGNRHNPEDNTDCPLEFRRIAFRSSPPSDEPAEQGYRVQGRMGVSDQPVNGQPCKEHDSAKRYCCRYHV